MLQKAARDYLEDRAPLTKVREVLESDTAYDAELWKGAAEMGWLGVAIPEEYGGAGFGYLELAMVAEELGRSLAPIPVSSSVYLASEAILLAAKADQKERLLPGLASGAQIGTLAVNERIGQSGTAGVAATFDNGRLNGTKLPVPDGDVADLAVVAANANDGTLCLALVDLNQPQVQRRTLKSFDPTRSQASLTFSDAPAELLAGSGSGEVILRKVIDRAAVLFAFEQLGGAQRCLDMAREYAMERYAFGRPIGSFQALKHRLADMFVATELARSNCYYGAWALSNDSDELPLAACLSRVSATDAYEMCAREGLQIHGGVGFTWEYDCHMFLRRSKLIALALGGPQLWKDRMIQCIEDRDVA